MGTSLTTTFDSLTPSEAAFAGGIVGSVFIASLVFYVFVIIAWWKIFEKAGEKGWKSLIPFYNLYIFFKICGIKAWFWILLGITILGSVLMTVDVPKELQTVDMWTIKDYDFYATIDFSQHITYAIGMIISFGAALAMELMTAIKLAKVFGKGVGYMLGLIFLPNIFYLILGFGSAKYVGNKAAKEAKEEKEEE